MAVRSVDVYTCDHCGKSESADPGMYPVHRGHSPASALWRRVTIKLDGPGWVLRGRKADALLCSQDCQTAWHQSWISGLHYEPSGGED